MPQAGLIHIVGGGFHQLPLAETARSMGFRVLVTDMYPNPPAKAAADHFEQIDTTDAERTLRCAQRYGVDHIVTDMTDVAVPTVAYAAERLGLRGIGYETALRFTNKYVMRKALAARFQEHLPESHYFENARKAADFYREARSRGQWVVKPINSQGSRGVFVLGDDSPDPPDQRIGAAYAESRERGILLESFVPGAEYSAETFVRDGQVHNLTLTKKYHYRQNPCLDERNTFLGDVAPELEKAIFDLNERIIRELGLSFGNTHAEYKVHEDRIYLMEIAARSAGGSIGSKIIPFLTGFDCMRALLSAVTDRPFAVAVEDYRRRFAVLRFYNFPPGLIKKIHVNEDIVRRLMVFTLTEYLAADQTVPPLRDSRDRLGYFVAHGTDRQEVLGLEKEAERAVRLEYA